MLQIEGVICIIKYWAVDINGKKIKGTCEKHEFAQLEKSLRERRYYIYRDIYIKKYSEIFLKKPNMMDISILCSQLSIMLSAGITVSRALYDLEKQCSKNSLKKAIGIIREEVTKGKDLYESMSMFKNIFPEFMIEMIKVGEEAGGLEKVFEKLSEYYEKNYKIISSIKISLVYPITVLITSIFVILFLMINIVPQFNNIIVSSGGRVPALTKLVMYSCEFLKNNFIQILAAMIFMWTIFYRFCKKHKVMRMMENIKFKIPCLNKIYSDLMIFKMCSSMSMLVKSGVNTIRALKITGRVVENEIMQEKIEESIKYVEEGESICEALEKAKINDRLFLSLISVGENTGNMDNMFLKLEQLFGNKVDRCLKKMSKVVEPAIIILLSLFVGIFIISALMPIFTIMDSTL